MVSGNRDIPEVNVFKDPAFCRLRIALRLFLGLLFFHLCWSSLLCSEISKHGCSAATSCLQFPQWRLCSQGTNSYFSDDLQLACSPFPEFCQCDREDRQTAVPTDNVERSDILTVTSARQSFYGKEEDCVGKENSKTYISVSSCVVCIDCTSFYWFKKQYIC